MASVATPSVYPKPQTEDRQSWLGSTSRSSGWGAASPSSIQVWGGDFRAGAVAQMWELTWFRRDTKTCSAKDTALQRPAWLPTALIPHWRAWPCGGNSAHAFGKAGSSAQHRHWQRGALGSSRPIARQVCANQVCSLLFPPLPQQAGLPLSSPFSLPAVQNAPEERKSGSSGH